jgi:hypothetical protein
VLCILLLDQPHAVAAVHTPQKTHQRTSQRGQDVMHHVTVLPMLVFDPDAFQVDALQPGSIPAMPVGRLSREMGEVHSRTVHVPGVRNKVFLLAI